MKRGNPPVIQTRCKVVFLSRHWEGRDEELRASQTSLRNDIGSINVVCAVDCVQSDCVFAFWSGEHHLVGSRKPFCTNSNYDIHSTTQIN